MTDSWPNCISTTQCHIVKEVASPPKNFITPSLTFSLSDCNQGEDIQLTDSPAPWMSDRRWSSWSVFSNCKVKSEANVNNAILSFCSVMAPLIAEYDRHMNDMTAQLKKYQVNKEIFPRVRTCFILSHCFVFCFFPTGADVWRETKIGRACQGEWKVE